MRRLWSYNLPMSIDVGGSFREFLLIVFRFNVHLFVMSWLLILITFGVQFVTVCASGHSDEAVRRRIRLGSCFENSDPVIA